MSWIRVLPAFAWMACTPSPAEPAPTSPPVLVSAAPASRPAPPPPPVVARAPTLVVVGDAQALREGRVEFAGIVQPTKGGLLVRDVVLTFEQIRAALVGRSPLASEEALLGARLRVVADLAARPPAPEARAELVQQRGGQSLHALRLVETEVTKPPQTIEGFVSRSKGFFRVGEHLVARNELAWSLRGIDPIGKRVKLWGQS
ncbi:MAG: hypothetical protein AAGA56_25315, partial [Myxococcota bacterium]